MQELVLPQPGPIAQGEWEKEAAGDGSRREFERLLGESAPLAYRVARGVLRSSADAEDVAQEALLRAYRHFAGLRDRRRFRSWLVRIAFRLALDRLRASKRRETRETLWWQSRPGISVEHAAATSEFQAHFERALSEMPGKYRLVLLLSAMEGHTLDEIAALLDVPLGTVKSRLFCARKRLAEKLRCHVQPTKVR